MRSLINHPYFYGLTKNEENQYLLIFHHDYNKCKSCYGQKGDGWKHLCQSCKIQFFKFNFSNWSSGNVDIDNIIRSSQLNAKNVDEVINWVLFSEFRNKKIIHQSEFGLFYKAEWRWFERWNLKTKVAKRINYSDNRVVLKYSTLPNLINEVCYHCVAFLI